MYTKDDNKAQQTPGTPAQPSAPNNPINSNRAFAGVIVLVIGCLLLAKKAGADIPHWVLSIGSVLIIVGLFMGYKQKFRHWVWLIPTIFGVLFLANDIIDGFAMRQFIAPLIIITVGLVLIFRPKKSKENYWKNWEASSEENTGEDFVDTTTIFGAVKKNIISKNFRGGDVTSIFGGVELYLGQADIVGRADLDLTHIFGGAKIVVPSDWRIQTDEVVCIFGGLDDKRKNIPTSTDSNKVLVLHGTVIFGGIDIKNY
jgi:predicted membrane protein